MGNYKTTPMKDRLRVDIETKNMIKSIRCDVEKIEGKRIPDGEIVRRVFKAPDIPDRLRIGAYNRRRR